MNKWTEEKSFHSCIVNFDKNDNPLCTSISLEDGAYIKIYDMATFPSKFDDFWTEGDPIIRVTLV